MLTRTGLIASYACLVAVFAIPDAHAGQIQYFYDSLGRVERVIYPNGVTVQYTYDAAGNRITVVKS